MVFIGPYFLINGISRSFSHIQTPQTPNISPQTAALQTPCSSPQTTADPASLTPTQSDPKTQHFALKSSATFGGYGVYENLFHFLA